jgi:uncharacterized protein (TIGR02145 family)
MSITRSLLIGLVAVSAGIAQNINISGKVTDTDTTPISGAIVKLERCGLTATTGADGKFTISGTITGISGQISQSFLPKPAVTIYYGLLCLTVHEKSAIEIVTYTVQGKVVSKIQKTIDVGTHSIAFPRIGAGVNLYKIKSGNGEFLMKSSSLSGISAGTAVFIQGTSSTALTRQAINYVPINDIIAVTKDGYLYYRVKVLTSDTSGIEIKMIKQDTGSITDNDGNVYKTIKIGNQVWMVENLRTTKYNNGTPIPLVTDSATWVALTTPGYCSYNNTTNADSIKKHGVLYNWYAVTNKMFAPTGWNIPTNADWATLENYLIANGYNWDGSTAGNKIAKSLAAKAGWYVSTNPGAIGNDLTKNNLSGFSALPGGFRNYKGHFINVGLYGSWWCASETDALYAYGRYLGYDFENLYSYSYFFKSSGFSVRLVR